MILPENGCCFRVTIQINTGGGGDASGKQGLYGVDTAGERTAGYGNVISKSLKAIIMLSSWISVPP